MTPSPEQSSTEVGRTKNEPLCNPNNVLFDGFRFWFQYPVHWVKNLEVARSDQNSLCSSTGMVSSKKQKQTNKNPARLQRDQAAWRRVLLLTSAMVLGIVTALQQKVLWTDRDPLCRDYWTAPEVGGLCWSPHSCQRTELFSLKISSVAISHLISSFSCSPCKVFNPAPLVPDS